MIFKRYIKESIDDMDKRCEFCNTLLNDGGTCPVCDDGEEDYGDEVIVEDISVREKLKRAFPELQFDNNVEEDVKTDCEEEILTEESTKSEEVSEEEQVEEILEDLSVREKLKAKYPELNFDGIEESVEEAEEETLTEELGAKISFANSDEQKEFFDLCKEIGIKTAGDLKRFVEENVTDGSEVLKVLRDYRAELGDDFEIQHESFESGTSIRQKLKAAYPELNIDLEESIEEIDSSEDSWYDDDYSFDDVEEDRRHAALYGGDRNYCECGTKLVRTEWGGYCPICEPDAE